MAKLCFRALPFSSELQKEVEGPSEHRFLEPVKNYKLITEARKRDTLKKKMHYNVVSEPAHRIHIVFYVYNVML